MKINIEIAHNGDKVLFLRGDFVASFAASVDDMEVIIPYALNKAFEMGAIAKSKEVKKVLSLTFSYEGKD